MEQFNSTLPEGKKVTCLEDLGLLSMKELKQVLQVYNGKKSGVKADLVLRVYAIFCRIEDQTNPSALRANTYSNDSCSNFWTYDTILKKFCSILCWTSDLRGTPPFSFIQLYDYLVIRTKKYKHILLKSTSYKKLKAFQFFYEGFIRKMSVARNGEFTFFDVRVKASMKRVVYKVILKLCNISGDVCSAACTCPAGIGLGGFGSCNHVGGVLFALEDFNRKGFQKCSEPVSCTSLLCSWNVPARSLSQIAKPVPIDKIVIRKIKFGRDDGNLVVPHSNLYDPRASFDRNVDKDRLAILTSKLSSVLPNSCYFGFHDIEDTTQSGQCEHTETKIASSDAVNSSDSCAFNCFFDISCDSFKEMMDIYCDRLIITREEVVNIDRETLGQSSNAKWMKHRQYRITASNFYSFIVNTLEPSAKLRHMYYSSFKSVSTDHGNKFEGHVRVLYCKAMHEKGNNVTVNEVGLKVSQPYPYLGASLDGLVSCNGEVWGLEIKCPSSKYNSNLHEAVKDKKFFLKKTHDEVKLNRKSRYYYQVQGQMFCADLKRTDFVVWFSDAEPLFIETIYFDEMFMLTCALPKLKYFYCRAVLPEYFTRRVQHGLKLYLQDGWENFKETKAK